MGSPPPRSRGMGTSPGEGLAGGRLLPVAVPRDTLFSLTELLPTLLGGQGLKSGGAQLPSDLHLTSDHGIRMLTPPC